MAKQPSFLNPSAAPAKPSPQWSAFLDGWVRTRSLALLLLAVIVACATIYYIGTQSSWGIKPTFENASGKAGFLDCLHFSVVTITTLGYGDYRPESYGRLVAGAEAVSGLVLMGIFISRLVSRRQDYLTKRLVSGQLNAELQAFRDKLAGLLGIFRTNPPMIAVDTQSQLLHDTGALAKSIGSYWRHEARHLDLPDVLPVRAASRLLGDLITVMGAVSSSIAGKTRADLHPDDVIAITRIAESTLTTATVLADRVVDQSTAHLYERVAALVEQFRAQLEQLPKPGKSTSRARRRERRQRQYA
jgi:hypothetical protein